MFLHFSDRAFFCCFVFDCQRQHTNYVLVRVAVQDGGSEGLKRLTNVGMRGHWICPLLLALFTNLPALQQSKVSECRRGNSPPTRWVEHQVALSTQSARIVAAFPTANPRAAERMNVSGLEESYLPSKLVPTRVIGF